MEILFALKPLYVAALGLALILGLRSRAQVGRSLLRMVLLMIFLPFMWSAGRHVAAEMGTAWAALPFGSRLLLLGGSLSAALLLPLVGSRFGREVLASILGNAAYDGLRSRGCSLGCLPALLVLLVLLALLS